MLTTSRLTIRAKNDELGEIDANDGDRRMMERGLGRSKARILSN